MVSFGNAIKMFYTRYVDFEGRSTRAEYWWVQLFFLLVFFGFIFLVIIVGMATGGFSGDEPSTAFIGIIGIFYLLYILLCLGSFIPGLAVTVRRLHDQDKSGWMYLLILVPLAGPIILLVFLCLEGTPGPNRFGPDPLGRVSAETFE